MQRLQGLRQQKLEEWNDEERKLIKDLPVSKPEQALYEQVQLIRFFPGNSLQYLEEEHFTFTSTFTQLVKLKITGDLQRLMQNLHWSKSKRYTKQEGFEEPVDILMQIFSKL
mgnify:CR=1 FL=1